MRIASQVSVPREKIEHGLSTADAAASHAPHLDDEVGSGDRGAGADRGG